MERSGLEQQKWITFMRASDYFCLRRKMATNWKSPGLLRKFIFSFIRRSPLTHLNSNKEMKKAKKKGKRCKTQRCFFHGFLISYFSRDYLEDFFPTWQLVAHFLKRENFFCRSALFSIFRNSEVIEFVCKWCYIIFFFLLL